MAHVCAITLSSVGSFLGPALWSWISSLGWPSSWSCVLRHWYPALHAHSPYLSLGLFLSVESSALLFQVYLFFPNSRSPWKFHT